MATRTSDRRWTRAWHTRTPTRATPATCTWVAWSHRPTVIQMAWFSARRTPSCRTAPRAATAARAHRPCLRRRRLHHRHHRHRRRHPHRHRHRRRRPRRRHRRLHHRLHHHHLPRRRCMPTAPTTAQLLDFRLVVQLQMVTLPPPPTSGASTRSSIPPLVVLGCLRRRGQRPT